MPKTSECPACGGGLLDHEPESAERYEWWKFACDAEVIRMDDGALIDESPCREALRMALKEINETTTSQQSN